MLKSLLSFISQLEPGLVRIEVCSNYRDASDREVRSNALKS